MKTLNKVNTHKMTHSRTFTLVGLLFLFILGKMVLVSCDQNAPSEQTSNKETENIVESPEEIKRIIDVTDNVSAGSVDVIVNRTANSIHEHNMVHYDTIIDTVNHVYRIYMEIHIYYNEVPGVETPVEDNFSFNILDLDCDSLDGVPSGREVTLFTRVHVHNTLENNTTETNSGSLKTAQTCIRNKGIKGDSQE